MRTSSIFVVAVVLGAVVVFLIRAAQEPGAGSTAENAASPPLTPPESMDHDGHGDPAVHEGHGGGEPSSAGGHAPDLSADDRPPENLLCPVMGGAVDPAVFVDYQGRRIAFCCPGCDAEFLAHPETYLAKVDEELARRAREAGAGEAAADGDGR